MYCGTFTPRRWRGRGSEETMERPDRNIQHEWHVMINQFNERKPWMYDAMTIADEIPRMTMLFKMERLGELPNVHQQCSHSDPEPIKDNHLTCCLGKKCKECPYILALESASISREVVDEMKAWTCAVHIISEKAKNPNSFDDSEGFILTVDDMMYWQRVYESLSHHNQ